jgi:hypothetical protein
VTKKIDKFGKVYDDVTDAIFAPLEQVMNMEASSFPRLFPRLNFVTHPAFRLEQHEEVEELLCLCRDLSDFSENADL